MATSLAFVPTDFSLDPTDEREGDTAQAVCIGKCVEPVPEAFRGGEVCTLYLEGQAASGKGEVQGGQSRTVRSAELHEKGRSTGGGFGR